MLITSIRRWLSARRTRNTARRLVLVCSASMLIASLRRRFSTRRSRDLARKVLLACSTMLLVSGAGVSAYEPTTNVLANHHQDDLKRQLTTTAEVYRKRAVRRGDALTRLQVPRLGIDVVVVEGTTPEALRAGAGHYDNTAYPGERGNVSIAGHRTTYGAPFNRIDEIVPGDEIVLTTPLERHVYRAIAYPWTVEPTDWSPIRSYPEKTSLLTLTSCAPEGSDSLRIVARALLFDSRPIPPTGGNDA